MFLNSQFLVEIHCHESTSRQHSNVSLLNHGIQLPSFKFHGHLNAECIFFISNSSLCLHSSDIILKSKIKAFSDSKTIEWLSPWKVKNQVVCYQQAKVHSENSYYSRGYGNTARQDWTKGKPNPRRANTQPRSSWSGTWGSWWQHLCPDNLDISAFPALLPAAHIALVFSELTQGLRQSLGDVP